MDGGPEGAGASAERELEGFGVVVRPAGDALPIRVVRPEDYDAWAVSAEAQDWAWLERTAFRAEDGAVAQVPTGVLAVSSAPAGFDLGAALGDTLPAGTYAPPALEPPALQAFAEGWSHGRYRYDGIRGTPNAPATGPVLACPAGLDAARAAAWAHAGRMMRDLTNTPRSHLGPEAFEAAVREEAARHGAEVSVLAGDALAAEGFGLIHAVGRASDEAPRLIDVRWGDSADPEIVLVGKGITYDAGGLNLKAWPGMMHMHMDMAGAASALALAVVVMRLGLKVRLRVLLPVADNSVDANAYRPSDVLLSRSGQTVEILNTDSEGRLLLADALWEGSRSRPRLVVDLATLTGARLYALGYETAAVFSNTPALAARLLALAAETGETFAHLPLTPAERPRVRSEVADLRHRTEGDDAQTVLAALFLDAFVPPETPWLHLDFGAWRIHPRPGRRRGAEPQAIRTLLALIEEIAGEDARAA